QLDGGDAETGEMFEDRVARHAEECPAQFFRNAGVAHRHAAYMGLVNDCFRPWPTDRGIARPVEVRVLHHALHREGGAVALVEGKVGRLVADAIAVKRVVPRKFAGDLLGIGIEQQLVGIEPMPLFRLVGSMGAIAVERARFEARDIAGPDVSLPLGQGQPGCLLLAVVAEKAKVDLFGMGGKDGEMRPFAGEFRPEFRLEEIEFREGIAHEMPPCAAPYAAPYAAMTPVPDAVDPAVFRRSPGMGVACATRGSDKWFRRAASAA